MARSRSRSPSREGRYRRRSRSREARRRRTPSRERAPYRDAEGARPTYAPPGSYAAPPLPVQYLIPNADAQAAAALATQQLLATQAMLAGTGAGTSEAARKQREIYFGNLAAGVVTPDIMTEFFNQVFAHMTPDPLGNPPVTRVKMDPQGRFAFVEFRTEEMAREALKMDKVVELCGRTINAGRPKGYLESLPALDAARLAMGASLEGAAGGESVVPAAPAPPSPALLLSNVLPAARLRDAQDREVLREEVAEEAAKFGGLLETAVPEPPSSVQDAAPGRAYLLFSSGEEALRARKAFHTRTLDGNVIRAVPVDLDEWARAREAVWVARQRPVGGLALTGLYARVPLAAGITGLAALNPQLPGVAHATPGLAQTVWGAIEQDEVPFEEGWVKVRGFSLNITKDDLIQFFQPCGDLALDDVLFVQSADGTPLGEAFLHFKGKRARVRLALARDQSIFPVSKTTLDVLTAVEEDKKRRILSGCKLV